jgi:hypothetical protein
MGALLEWKKKNLKSGGVAGLVIMNWRWIIS